jgi:riboflavin kinase, archaea type
MIEKTRLLIYLADKGAMQKQIELSTITIAKETGSSQQTISRKLIELEHEGSIERQPSTRGINLILKENGIEKLKEIYIKLKSTFGERISSIKGVVESGFGEGSYYVSLKQYQEQFKKKLGYLPFSGTLNIRVDYNEFLQFIAAQQKIMIDGFKTATRTFGSIGVYIIKVNGINSALVIPERTSHVRDTIEIISDVNFREKLKIKDKDIVEITT